MTRPIRRKLIEVSIPLEAINVASAREKSIRHGHPSTLHLWWARRPLAACRAVLFAQLVDDPSSWPERFPTQEAQDAERRRLHKVIEAMVPWEASNDEAILNAARWEIARSVAWGFGEEPPVKGDGKAILDYLQTKAPPVYDPFSGGGSIPLEAQRLGLRAYGSDLNPVAVLIGKALVEIPPKFAGRPPVNPEARAEAANSLLGPRASRPHKGWHARGYLPHFDSAAVVQSLTFRLADSLPREAYDEATAAASDDAGRRERLDAMIDSGRGSCLLRDPENAGIVRDALKHFDGERYRLLAWSIMPNHVHAVIEQIDGHPLGEVVQAWKSFTAKAINRRRGQGGPVWAPDYFDRFIRDEAHLAAAIHYVEDNPVKAGLVRGSAAWRFSSAGERAGGTPAVPGGRTWKGAQGLAEDVRYYGRWMRDEAEKRIGHLYPKATLPDGSKATVIAWLWARTVRSPDPAAKGAMVPLVSSFMLSTKEGKKAWVEPVIDPKVLGGWRFEVHTGACSPEHEEKLKAGTKASRGASFRCILTNSPIDPSYVRSEAQAGRMGEAPFATVADGSRWRVFLTLEEAQASAAIAAHSDDRPDELLHRNSRYMTPTIFGLEKVGDLFLDRQIAALNELSYQLSEVRKTIASDVLSSDKDSAADYAQALAIYLALCISRQANRSSSLCFWDSEGHNIQQVFARQALSMTWDFVESNPFSTSRARPVYSGS